MELEAQEKSVGPFRADILCKNTADDTKVLIENQIKPTDHLHLGQLLTYAAGLQSVVIVWIASKFNEDHRKALDWLNEISVPCHFDQKLLKAFAKAYKWKTLIEDQNQNKINSKINSLADIARSENISMSHATKIYRLNFISPKIVENIVNGTAPRDLRLQDIFANKAPELWQEQEERWGF